MEPAETVKVGKDALGPDGALELARAARTVVIARGKKLVEFDMKRDAPSDDELLGLMLGRSGKLRAPTIRVGNKLLVGYNADLYGSAIG